MGVAAPSDSACFTYGSLMWADIMARVCARDAAALNAAPATLRDHARHPVMGQDYPGLVARAGAGPVKGVLYTGLSAQEFERLDAFEGDEYERVRVTAEVEGPDGAACQTAWVYRFRAEFADRLEPGDWSVEDFEAQGKARFCERYVGFVQSAAG